MTDEERRAAGRRRRLRLSAFAPRDTGLMLWRALGAFLAVAIMEGAAHALTLPYAYIPFVTSIVLVIGAPDAAPARPRALIGGHLVSALCGYPMLWLFGSQPLVAAAGVGLALLAMHRTGCFHPPAGINPFLIVNEGLGLRFILLPVAAGALLLAAYALLWQHLARRVAAGEDAA